MIPAILLSLAALAAPQGAAPAQPVFTVLSPTGAAVDARDVLTVECRLVVYVAPAIEPAARLVDALRRWSEADPRHWNERVLLIVAAPPQQARDWVTRQWGSENLPRWVADPEAAAWRALGFQGTLAVAGIANAAVEWKIDGVIANPSVIEPAARAWIEGSAQ